MDTNELCNTILYYLSHHGHGDDLINPGKLTNITWLINVIHTIKYNESALTPKALLEFEIGYYGPFNKNIIDTFDPIDMYDTDYTPHYVKSSIQDQYLIKNGNVFDVKVIPFDYLTVPRPVRQIVEQHVLPLWQTDNFELSQIFQNEPQVKTATDHFDHTYYNLTKSVDYFRDHPKILSKIINQYNQPIKETPSND